MAKNLDDKSAPEAGPQPAWHAMSVDAVLKERDTSREDGLSSTEAARRLETYGPNQLTEKKKKTLLQRIWSQVNNVLVGILVTVAVVSAGRAITSDTNDDIVSNWLQVAIIIGVISLNTYIGLLQEGSAEKAAEALRAMLSSNAKVIRDGVDMEVPAADVVPGDLVKLALGDRVPADMRMIRVGNLACAEAALTGESVPIDKMVDPIDCGDDDPDKVPLGDRKNMCYSATLVAQGGGIGIAIYTGDHTQIGTINALVNKVEKKKTNVLQQIDNVSKILAFFIALTGFATFAVAFWQTGLSAIDSVAIALVCAVAMIPEGLEAIVTVTYANGVSNMANHNAIVRLLPAVETLGSVTVICSDKTGTLTKNEMSLVAFVTSNARYKYDVHSKERSNTNFVRDDAFMAQRASQHKGRKAKSILRKQSMSFGGENKKSEPGNVDTSGLMEWEGGDDDAEAGNSSAAATSDKMSGESPTLEYLRSALAGGVLCTKSQLGPDPTQREGEMGNPTELAIMRAAYLSGVDIASFKSTAPDIAEVPFSSEYKFMATVHEPIADVDGEGLDGQWVVHVKGAPDKMLPLCSHQARGGMLNDLEPIEKEMWVEQIATLSSHGLRVLALMRGSVPKDEVQPGQDLTREFVDGRGEPWLTLVGLCAIMDPPRPECIDAIREAHGAGVRVAMITGDHRDTAVAIGDMLGLVDEKYNSALTGPELDAMDDDELRTAVLSHNVFARASPQNKLRIVKALQAEKQVSGMTGDGVNDAPALKAADMGVAMGKEGTDVAREASEMILADDNFATIITAVREGRVVWDNLRKVLMVNTPINNAQGMSVLFGMICGLEDSPLTPIQVLYCNLICAVTLGFVTAVEPAEDGIMSVPPRRVGKRLIGRYLFLRIALGTAVLVACTVGSVFWARSLGYNLDKMRSQASNTLTFGAMSITLSARFSYNASYHKRLLTGNKYMWYSVIAVTAGQVFITYVPGVNDVIFGMAGMDGKQWGIVVLGMVITFVVMEIEKAVRRRLRDMGKDTDDVGPDELFDAHEEEVDRDSPLVPKGASKLQLAELNR